MTSEEQRLAIAKACGLRMDRPATGWHDYGCDCQRCYPLPDYTYDLNAMHNAERVLDSKQEWEGEEHHTCAEEAYMGHLSRIVARDSKNRFSDDWHFVTATAAQRAEAFLRTIGKWED